MANLVEFLVKVKDLASSPLSKIGASGGKSFAQLDTGLSKFNSRLSGLKMSIGDIDKKLNDLRKSREISLDSSQIRRVNREIGELERRKAKLEGKGSGGGSLLSFAGGGGLAGMAMAAVSSAGIGSLLKAGMDKEQTRLSFTTMLGGDAGKSKAVMGGLNKFANETPFTNNEVLGAGRSMLAFGFSEKELLPSLKRVGDVASGLQIPFGELSEIYGKARVQGTLFAEDLNQLAGRGIPIASELGKVLGVPQEQIKELASAGKITFPMMEQAFTNMTSKGGLFDDMMKKQSETAGGRWSTLMGVASSKLTDFSESLLPVTHSLLDFGNWIVNNLPVIGSLTGAIATFAAVTKAAAIWPTVLAAGTTLWSIATGKLTIAQWALNTAMFANPITWIAAGLAAVVGGVIYCWNTFEGFRGFLYGLWESIKTIFSSVADIISGALNLNPAQIERGLLQWEQIGNNYAKGFNEGVADFKWDKATEHEGGLLSFFGAGKGADEIKEEEKKKVLEIKPPSSATNATNGITGGGSKNVTINVGKMIETLLLHSNNLNEGMNDIEKKVAEVLMRIVSSGGAASFYN